MSAPEPEILSMEEVRRFARAAERINYSLPADDTTRLCLTVEHYATLAQRHSETSHERDAAAYSLAIERDRLRALVAGMREWVLGHDHWLGCSIHTEGDRCGCGYSALLLDDDGQRAYDLATKDREDAEKWRALMAEAEEHLKEPEHAAFIARATQAFEEGEEELRLLRAWESARASQIACEAKCRESEETDPLRVLLGMATSDAAERATWTALSAFRARQKGGQK